MPKAPQRSIPSLLVYLAIALFIALGMWQLQRLNWKLNLIAMAEVHYERPRLLVSSINEIPDGLFHRLVLKGTFRYDDTLRIIARYHDKTLGYHLVTPLALEDGVVLVNRGWVEVDTPLKTGTAKASIEGVVIHDDGQPAFFLPQHAPEKNEWITLDRIAMSAHLGLESLPIVVQQTKSAKGEPLALPFELRFYNQHFEYAMMWFAIAFATLIMHLVGRRKPS